MATLIWQPYPASLEVVMRVVPVRIRRLRWSRDQKRKKQASGEGSDCGYHGSNDPSLFPDVRPKKEKHQFYNHFEREA